MQAVWPDTTVEESNLTYHVFAIRKALGESGDSGPFIETVPKRGYRFVAAVRRVDDGDVAQPASTTAVSAERRAGSLDQSEPPERSEDKIRPSQAWPHSARFSFLFFPCLRRRSVEIVSRFVSRSRSRDDLAESGMFSVSPDGRRLVFAAEGADGIMRLWMRNLSVVEPVPLPGTEVFTIIPP